MAYEIAFDRGTGYPAEEALNAQANAQTAGIYFVTVMGPLKPRQRVIKAGPRKSEVFTRDERSTRCWGWCKTLAEAENALRRNVTDMYEFSYEVAVIERIDHGMAASATEESWWKFDTDANEGLGGYVKADRPADLTGTMQFAIG